jgi:hypothetical protein
MDKFTTQSKSTIAKSKFASQSKSTGQIKSVRQEKFTDPVKIEILNNLKKEELVICEEWELLLKIATTSCISYFIGLFTQLVKNEDHYKKFLTSSLMFFTNIDKEKGLVIRDTIMFPGLDNVISYSKRLKCKKCLQRWIISVSIQIWDTASDDYEKLKELVQINNKESIQNKDKDNKSKEKELQSFITSKCIEYFSQYEGIPKKLLEEKHIEWPMDKSTCK